MDDDSNKVVDYDMTSQCFISFYSLFSSVNPSFPNDFHNFIQPSISTEVNCSMIAIHSIADLHKALFSMDNNKSPGPDDMSPIFFKTYWHIIDKDIHAAICGFFTNATLSTTANHIFITLIPKKLATNRVDQFCPIALCNVVYKVITKIISNRLRPVLDTLIHPN